MTVLYFVFSLATGAFTGFTFKKNKLQNKYIKRLEADIDVLKMQNKAKNSVIIQCDISTKNIEKLRRDAEQRAEDERVKRLLEQQKIDIMRKHDEAKIKALLNRTDCDNPVLDSELARLFDQAMPNPISAGSDRDSN